jgi:hypothetical protein
MKYIKGYRIFESNIETIKMECEDILLEIRDLGLLVEIEMSKSWPLVCDIITITIKNGTTKLNNVYKTKIQTPILEHLFSYLDDEGFMKKYDVLEIIYTTKYSKKNGFDRFHKIKFESRFPNKII